MKITLITAALSLAMSVIAAKAADIHINALPFYITSPGIYVLTSNLSTTLSGNIPIIIYPVAGDVTLDLKGFTLSVSNNIAAVFVEPVDSSIASGKVTIRNGVIQQSNVTFNPYGVLANQNLFRTPGGYMTHLTIEKITFSGYFSAGITLSQVNSSSVTDCAFTCPTLSPTIGIRDIASQGGNVYKNCKFDGNEEQELVINGGQTPAFFAGPVLIDVCRSAPPTP